MYQFKNIYLLHTPHNLRNLIPTHLIKDCSILRLGRHFYAVILFYLGF